MLSRPPASVATARRPTTGRDTASLPERARTGPRDSNRRVRLAVGVGKAVATLSKVAHRGAGGVIGGRAILALAPSAAASLARARSVYLVSGTNGKTTTSALLAAALRTQVAVASNADGANTNAGIVTALAKRRTETVVLETDEGWLPWAVAQTGPAAVVLLNLSRDQLTRHHEVGRIVSSWRRVLRDVPLVVANADDPNVVWPAMAASSQVWVGAGQEWTQDSVACPRCGRACRRDGAMWSCACGLQRPEPSWWLDGDDLVGHGARVRLDLGLPGRFNQANAALAVAAAVGAGVDATRALEAMHSIADVGGRFGLQTYQGRQVRLLLAKNPAGWLETIRLVSHQETTVVLALNSDGVDGRDPSWLYDVSFRALAGRQIVVTGRRSSDLTVRLKLDGVDCVATRDIVGALSAAPPGRVDVIADYTAFQHVRRELADASGQ